MKGVILRINPTVRLVDLSHEVSPQNIREGAYIIGSAYRYFPADAVHLVVVDPGVGSGRRGVALHTEHGFFVAPDNGVLSLVLAQEPVQQAVELAMPKYWLNPVSATFHGRDIFAPVAAYISLGVPLASFGPVAKDIKTFTPPAPCVQSDGSIIGEIVYIDRFGNLVTNLSLPADTVQSKLKIQVGERYIQSVQHTFASVDAGELVAYVGSNQTLEIAVRDGNACETLDVSIGDKVTLFRDCEA